MVRSLRWRVKSTSLMQLCNQICAFWNCSILSISCSTYIIGIYSSWAITYISLHISFGIRSQSKSTMENNSIIWKTNMRNEILLTRNRILWWALWTLYASWQILDLLAPLASTYSIWHYVNLVIFRKVTHQWLSAEEQNEIEKTECLHKIIWWCCLQCRS